MNEHITEVETVDGEPVRIREPIHPWRWRMLTIWCIAVMGALAWGWTALQQSRVNSCKDSYEGTRRVFLQFRSPPNKSTPAEQDRWDKFDRTIDRQKAQCSKQVAP